MSPFSLGILGAAHVPPAAVGIHDSFNRADSGSLGTSDSGHAWVADLGAWGITSNQAWCNNSNGVHRATIDYEADVDVSASVTGTQFCGVLARRGSGATASHFYELIYDATSAWRLYRRAGSRSEIGAGWTAASPSGTVARLVVREVAGQTELTAYIDGVSRITYTDTAAGRPAGIGVGICKVWGNTSPRFDNFAAIPA